MAGLQASDLDMIIVGTVTPDMPMPATAVYVQQKLGAGKDVAIAAAKNQVCALWVSSEGLEAWRGTGKPVQIAKEAAFPSVVALPGGGFLAAWEAAGSIGVKRLP